GILEVRIGEKKYPLNLKIAVPVTVLTGFAAGMVGVSGGSFLVPLMVLACGVPVHIAVGTASILVAATAFMGFAGHALRGDFDPHLAIPLAVITIIGGTLGGKFALKSKPHHLKRLFAYTNFLAAGFMLFNALRTGGII
ncbi:MAG TPA: sulfite exporter TauE/SafE family protein, partial [candidate division Zixibacteria bacterium]|nr:sulfite exporter TauE/SafE family protein [candidate division Zixibacteria bacterium]